MGVSPTIELTRRALCELGWPFIRAVDFVASCS